MFAQRSYLWIISFVLVVKNRKPSNLCLIYAPGSRLLTIGTLRFFVRFKLGEREEENICYYKLSQPTIQTPLAVTLSYFETLRKCCLVYEKKVCRDKHSPQVRYTIVTV